MTAQSCQTLEDLPPWTNPLIFVTSGDQQVPGTLKSQVLATGVHWGNIIAASTMLVIELNAMNAWRNHRHLLLVTLG